MLLALGLLLAGCGPDARPHRVPAPLDQHRMYVEELLPDFDAAVQQELVSSLLRAKLRARLQQEIGREYRERLDGGLRYASTLDEHYRAHGDRAAFVGVGGLNARGEQVVGVLMGAEHHGLSPASFHVAGIQSLSRELAESGGLAAHWRPMRLEPAEAEALVDWVGQLELDVRDPASLARVLAVFVDAELPPGAPAGFERLRGQVTQFRGSFEPLAARTAELELRVADGALRYAREMKHFNLNRMDWKGLREAGGSTEVILGRMKITLAALVEGEPEQAGEVLEVLAPPHAQYARLKDALARYRAIAAGGGWPLVRETTLEPGAHSPMVARLRQRLALEGYLDQPMAPAIKPASGDLAGEMVAEEGHLRGGGSGGDVVDGELMAAVQAYQDTHQLAREAQPTYIFWRSLNVPVERRIAQLALGLQRWRESRYEGEPDYIFVNIPDFHAEVYRQGARQMRFRVIVGNDKRVCDPKTNKWVYPNATPAQFSAMDHLILNPSWYVPERLVVEAVMPKVRGDAAAWFKANGYEVTTSKGRRLYRQLPGRDNALGVAKFIFPSPHNTYLHDTPQKHYFDTTVRAYSFGCVRVQEPVALARYLVEQDGQSGEVNVDEVIASGKTRMVKFRQGLPVFVEYITVRVGDEGRVHFLTDVYRQDLRRLAENPDDVDSCNFVATPEGLPGLSDPAGRPLPSALPPTMLVEPDIGP